MTISDIKIRMVKNNSSRLKAVASMIIDGCFVVHDIKILEGNTEGYFLAMPTRKTAEGEYKDIAHPLDSSTRQLICDKILDEFYKLLEEQKA